MSSNTPYNIATRAQNTATSSTALISFAQRVNADIATNLNDLAITEVPMDGALTTNQTGFAINGNGIQYNDADTVWVRCSFNLSVTASFNRGNMVARLAVDTGGGPVLFGPEASHGYIRNSNGHQQSSYAISGTWIELSTGDTITVQTIREANAGTITMNAAGTSQLLLEVLKNV